MKAVVHEHYGPPLEVMELRDVPEPKASEGEVLVRVRAASVNPADWHFLRATPGLVRLQAGLRAPKTQILGCDLAGTVEAVGEGVSSFAAGDEVYGCTFMKGWGAFGELAVTPEDSLAVKPAGLSFEEAAAIPAAAQTALQGLRDHAEVKPGDRVLVIGAGGGVGTFAVQIAKHLGALVTAVCGTDKAELVRALGAESVIDYTREDTAGTGPYDVVFQLAGTASPSELRKLLTDDGTLLISSGDGKGGLLGPVKRSIRAAAMGPFVSQKLSGFTVDPNGDDLRAVSELVDSKAISPVIGKTYPLAEVPQAIADLEGGHARGKIVVTVPD